MTQINRIVNSILGPFYKSKTENNSSRHKKLWTMVAVWSVLMMFTMIALESICKTLIIQFIVVMVMTMFASFRMHMHSIRVTMIMVMASMRISEFMNRPIRCKKQRNRNSIAS